jgi:GNAT superfamily N-acetyltransferase
MASQLLTPSDVVFHEATNIQREQTWRLNGLSWAGQLSINDYVQREVHLANTDFTANGKNKYWVLTRNDKAEDADDAEIVASCETTSKRVLCAKGDSDVQEFGAYAIASVYTNPKYRRCGMAALLLNKLKEWMDGKGDAEFSALYSDIGLVSIQPHLLTSSIQLTSYPKGLLCETRLGCISG